ncbi:MAG: hypothetical protein HY077_03330 [Elusimicrobia bacterium]|nr:hypothetical protein [Elusimicrobiota bacterium]
MTKIIPARFRKVVVVALAGFAASMAWLGYIHLRYEQLKTDSDRLADALSRCGRLRLGMTRDEIVAVMGPPRKEYEVRPAGKGSQALFREMLFTLPVPTPQAPYVDLQLKTERAVEIYCTQNSHVVLPDEAQADLVRDADSLPSSQ